MKVIVTQSNGSTSTITAEHLYIRVDAHTGSLQIVDDSSNVVAVHAPGSWHSAERQA